MHESIIKIRLMRADDFDAVLGIDRKVLKASRLKYYEMKFINHLRNLDVKKVNTLVDKNDSKLIKFFNANQFSTAKSIVSLERTL